MREVVSPSLRPTPTDSVPAPTTESVSPPDPISDLANGIDRLADETQNANRDGQHTKRLQFVMLGVNLIAAVVVVYVALLVLAAITRGTDMLTEVQGEVRSSVSVNRDLARSVGGMIEARAAEETGDYEKAGELREEATKHAVAAEVKAAKNELAVAKKRVAARPTPKARDASRVQILNEQFERAKRKAEQKKVDVNDDELGF
jgi:hypothetical protein